jgi:CRISPR-associated endonuclease/helicase Cas3
MVTARALGENLIATVEKDGGARPEVVTHLRGRVDAALANHAERLGCPAQNLQAKSAFERCAAGKPGARWIETYRRLNRFRTSLPSVRVHDFMEQSRRKEWELGEYDIDLATLLKRAVGLAWNEKLAMLTIKGIGKHRRVHASEIFSDHDCGIILETKDFPSLLLYQDGEPTPVSDLMGRQNHIFAVVARAAVQDEVDWRLPVFEAGKYLVVFDGAALLLIELWQRVNAAQGREPDPSGRGCRRDGTLPFAPPTRNAARPVLPTSEARGAEDVNQRTVIEPPDGMGGQRQAP